MPTPLAGETVCGKRKDRQELGLYFPVLTTSPACPQSGDNYISHAEIKNTSVKSIYMEKGKMEPNLGWDGAPYDWTNGTTEIQTNFVDTGASGISGNPNLLENSAFPTMHTDRWRFVFESFDSGAKSENLIPNSRVQGELYPWTRWGTATPSIKSYMKQSTFTPPEGTDLASGFEIRKDRGEKEISVGAEIGSLLVEPKTEYRLSFFARVPVGNAAYQHPTDITGEIGSFEKGFLSQTARVSGDQKWHRVSFLFRTRDREEALSLRIGIAAGNTGYVQVAGPVLTKGPQIKPWSPSPADTADVLSHPANWHYDKTPPIDKSLVWGDTSGKNDINPKKWTGSKWESLHLLNKAQYGGNVSLIEQKAGPSIQIQKEKEGVVGISQVVRVPSGIRKGDYLNASFELEEKTRSTGAMVRVEFYTGDFEYIHTSMAGTFHNIMVGKRRFDTGGTIRFTPSNPKEVAKFIRVTFMGNQNSGRVNLAATRFKIETGPQTTGWSLHEKETGFNLDAGQLKVPKIDGQTDKSKMIKEVAILRSALGENLLSWEEVTRIKATSLKGATLHDYFIENGGYYRYALQPIMADGSKGSITGFYDVVTTLEGFWLLGQDDMQFSFIYDGKIDNISHIKPTAFIETIASQYPYAVRSTETDYRRFGFSGKLTYQQDTQRLLTSNTYTQAVSPQSTNPIGFVELKYGDEMLLECQNDLAQMQEGMVMQRIWRHKLIDWMKDGKPKILKSEAEGNMLVMIDDIQISPVHTVYGLVADFTCSMIEIGKVEEETLQRFKLRKKEITHDDLRKSLLNENYSF